MSEAPSTKQNATRPGVQLVRVASAQNQAEAEFLQGMLRQEGIPSMLRRSRGFDVPGFLAAGPRDVLVPAPEVSAARDVLLQADAAPAEGVPQPVIRTRQIVTRLILA